jgi:hypothetical protein
MTERIQTTSRNKAKSRETKAKQAEIIRGSCVLS